MRVISVGGDDKKNTDVMELFNSHWILDGSSSVSRRRPGKSWMNERYLR